MKKLSKKIISSLIFTTFILGLIVFNASPIFAADSPEKQNIIQKYFQGLQPAIDQAYGGGESVKLQGDPFAIIIISIINSLLTFLSIIFFMLLLYAGWLWMTARGNEDQAAKAKKMIQNIIIGLFIIILAKLIVEFILSQISGSLPS